jgi:hypothetical protein
MNKMIKVALSALTVLSLSAVSASADADKGLKLYSKKLKESCKQSGAVIAGKHTQGDWEKINKSGKLADEIKKLCPAVDAKALDPKYLGDYYDFFHKFGSDSGNVPSC